MTDGVLDLLGLGDASSPSPDTPPLSERRKYKKCKRSNKRKRSKSEGANINKEPSKKKRKLSAHNVNTQPKKIGRKDRNIKRPIGITLSAMESIDAELEQALKKQQCTNINNTAFMKKITSDDDSDSDNNDKLNKLTIKDLGEYLAQSQSQLKVTHDSDNTLKQSEDDIYTKVKYNDYNPELMAEIDELLAPYQQETNELEKLKALNQKLNAESMIKIDEKKTAKSAKKKNKKKSPQKVKAKKKSDKQEMDDDSDNISDVLELKSKRTQCEENVNKTRSKASDRRTKRNEFMDLLKRKGASAEKRKKEKENRTKHNTICNGNLEKEEIDYDGLELIYVPETQVDTQRKEDALKNIEHRNSSINFDVFDSF